MEKVQRVRTPIVIVILFIYFFKLLSSPQKLHFLFFPYFSLHENSRKHKRQVWQENIIIWE